MIDNTDLDVPERRHRTLTDDDIEAICVVLKKKFYEDLGQGVWSMAWKTIILAIIALAAYGYTHKVN